MFLHKFYIKKVVLWWATECNVPTGKYKPRLLQVFTVSCVFFCFCFYFLQVILESWANCWNMLKTMPFMVIRFLSTLLMKPQWSGLYQLHNKVIKLSGLCDLSVPRTWDSINSLLNHLLEEAMAPHSSTLAWKIPWAEEPGGLQSMVSQRVGHDWVTSLSLFTFMRWRRKWQPTPVFLPGESQGWGSLVGCHLWGRTESDTTEVT